MTARWASILLAGLVSAGPLLAADPTVTTSYDVPFTTAGGVELRIDIAQPAMGEGPFPAVLVIHGGAWNEGGREENHRTLLELARRGYVAASPQYRFCPKDTFPAQLLDMKAAVRFLRSNAKSLKVDPARIAAMGFSAGGHLALLLGTTGPAEGFDGPESRGVPSARVEAVVDFYGPVDLTAANFSDTAKGYVACLTGAPAAEKPELAAKASPITYVGAGDAPVLVFHGAKDELVPPSQAFALMEKLSAAGVSGRVEFVLGAGHGLSGADWDRAWKEAVDFLDASLKKKRGLP
jgi:acetyl esterase/lipase